MAQGGRLKGKSAIVTGAASGIGLAIAQAFAGEGAHVLMTDLDATGGEAGARACGARFHRQNVADEGGWQEAVARAEAEFGRLDILVNNAGTGRAGNPETTTLKDWKLIHSVNLDSVFLGCKYAIPALRRAGGGAIVNIASCASVMASPDLVAYGASKAAVAQYTQSVAVHCGRMGYAIRCNAIAPGPTLTAIMARGIEQAPDPQAAREAWLGNVALGRFAAPEEIARMAVFLASDESSYATGALFTVDGGYSLGVV